MFTFEHTCKCTKAFSLVKVYLYIHIYILPRFNKNVHIYILIHVHMHKHIQPCQGLGQGIYFQKNLSYIYTFFHTYTCTNVQPYSAFPRSVRTYIYTFLHIYTGLTHIHRSYTYTHAHKHIQPCQGLSVHTYIHSTKVYKSINIYTKVYKYILTHIYTCLTHIRMHTNIFSLAKVWGMEFTSTKTLPVFSSSDLEFYLRSTLKVPGEHTYVHIFMCVCMYVCI
jgi:hypothetical protein